MIFECSLSRKNGELTEESARASWKIRLNFVATSDACYGAMVKVEVVETSS